MLGAALLLQTATLYPQLMQSALNPGLLHQTPCDPMIDNTQVEVPTMPHQRVSENQLSMRNMITNSLSLNGFQQHITL